MVCAIGNKLRLDFAAPGMGVNNTLTRLMVKIVTLVAIGSLRTSSALLTGYF